MINRNKKNSHLPILCSKQGSRRRYGHGRTNNPTDNVLNKS